MPVRFVTSALSVLLAAGFTIVGQAYAQSGPQIHSPVILMWDGAAEYRGATPNDVGNLQIREDGSGILYYSWPWYPADTLWTWDLTHDGRAGLRSFLGAWTSDMKKPDGSPYFDCVAVREDGDPATLRTLSRGGPNGLERLCDAYGGPARWSRDGTQILSFGRRMQDGQVVETGLYVADVQFDATGAPSSLANERPVFIDTPLDATHEGIRASNGTFSADGLRAAFSLTRSYRDAQGIVREAGLGLFVALVPDPTALQPPPPVSLGIMGGWPVFSPVAGDHRLAYFVTDATTRYGSNVFTVVVPPGYDGSTALRPVRVTAKTLLRLGYFDWSPDASFLVYTSCNVATDVYSKQVWKARSDGTGKPVRLIGDSDFYSIKAWRR